MLNRANIMSANEVYGRTRLGIKACPFCFSNNVGVYMCRHPYVVCTACEAEGPKAQGAYGNPVEEAVGLWNKRVGPIRAEWK